KDGKVTLAWTATNGSYYDVYIIPSNVEDFKSGVADLNKSVARAREEGDSTVISLPDGSYVAIAYARPGSVATHAESNRITFTLKNGTLEGMNPETPETSEPEDPETNEPEVPETSEPEAPETSEPETPETSEPETPETSEPETPETSEPETSEPDPEPKPDLTGDYKATAALNLRKAAGTSNTRLLTIPKGKTIKITEVKDGWGKTTYSGKTGWVSMDYVKKVETSTGSTGSTGSSGSTGSTGTTTTTYTYKITTTSGVNLRSGAGTSYGKLTTIPYNKTVTVTEVKNGWGKTTYGGKTGWFSLDYAKKTGTTTTATGGSTGSGDTTTTASVKYVITASNGVNMRSGAGTSYDKVGAIPYNKTVTVTEVKNGWGKTTYGGKTGWFSLDYAKKA
ncbi:MAG: SH3 domain-containing protein, partial [Clostridia bacterium]|nr:SH3 domain-containing protein [Clostridia bacterium]